MLNILFNILIFVLTLFIWFRLRNWNLLFFYFFLRIIALLLYLFWNLFRYLLWHNHLYCFYLFGNFFNLIWEILFGLNHFLLLFLYSYFLIYTAYLFLYLLYLTLFSTLLFVLGLLRLTLFLHADLLNLDWLLDLLLDWFFRDCFLSIFLLFSFCWHRCLFLLCLMLFRRFFGDLSFVSFFGWFACLAWLIFIDPHSFNCNFLLAFFFFLRAYFLGLIVCCIWIIGLLIGIRSNLDR